MFTSALKFTGKIFWSPWTKFSLVTLKTKIKIANSINSMMALEISSLTTMICLGKKLKQLKALENCMIRITKAAASDTKTHLRRCVSCYIFLAR